MTATEPDADEIMIDALLAEFKEKRRRKEENEGKLTRLEADIPKSIYSQSAQAAAQSGISLDEFIADALEIYLGDDYKPDEEA